MNQKLQKVGAIAISSTALLLSATPVFAADLVIKDNGKESTNTIAVYSDCKNTVKQDNYLSAKNNVKSKANSGGNSVNGNTNGTNSVETGDATSTVNITVESGNNTATAPDCCGCAGGDQTVKIEGNGNKSQNTVAVHENNKTKSTQYNTVRSRSKVKSKAVTGRNEVKNNTGGDNTVDTGDSESTVEIEVTGGDNDLE